MKAFFRRVLGRVSGYFRVNWGAPFVLGFMVLLIAAVACLLVDLGWWAEQVANYAYFSLVAGVVLQLACFFRHGEKGGSGD